MKPKPISISEEYFLNSSIERPHFRINYLLFFGDFDSMWCVGRTG